MQYDPSQLNRPRARGGASAAPRCHAAPGRARSRGDGVAVRRRLDRAGDRPASGVLRRDGAHGAQAVHPDRPDELAPPAAWPPEGLGARRTRHRGLESPPGRAADVDRRATGPRPTGGGHPAQHAADAQVPQAAGSQLAADRPHAPAQARPRPGGASEAQAGPPRKKGAQGLLQLAYLDECGFSPSLPVTATWVRRGERKWVPYENPQGRRWNTLVLYAPTGVQPAWDWIGKPRAFTAEDFVEFLLERPPCPVPLVIVLDNASLHRSQAVRAALPRLWARRIYFCFLPAYSPELNAIEPCFRVIKHDELPARVYTPLAALEAAVDEAYTRYETTLLTQCDTQLGLAA